LRTNYGNIFEKRRNSEGGFLFLGKIKTKDMEEDEILDSPENSKKVKKNIWIIRFITISIIGLALLFPRMIYLIFPSRNSNIVFGALSFSLFINSIGFLFFLKNIEYQSIKVINLLIQSVLLAFLGIILCTYLYNLSIFILPNYNMPNWSHIDLSLQNCIEMFSMSLILGLTIPLGIYYWLAKNNKWLLPLIILILFFLIYLGSL
jgi:hypothetical protein